MGYESPRTRRAKARERQMARQSRRSVMATISGQTSSRLRSTLPVDAVGQRAGDVAGRAALVVRDLLWYVLHTPQILLGLAALGGVIFLLFVATNLLGGRIFPNVWAAGVPLGGLTVEEARAALDNAWANSLRIALIDAERRWEVAPSEIGLQIDAQKTAEAARAVGLSGVPFGYGVQPVVSLDFTTAQSYMLDLSAVVAVPPRNGSFEWQSDQLIAKAGEDGRMLDVARMMDALRDDPVQIIRDGRLNLIMSPIEPEYPDPEPYLKTVQTVASQPFTMIGYDPFTNESLSWSTSRDVFTSWLEAGDDAVAVRMETFGLFLDAQNQSLNSDPARGERYLDPILTRQRLTEAINQQSAVVNLRIQYRPFEYQVERGDTGFRIARKTGVPFYLIEDANPGRDLGVLSPGDIVRIPAPDVTLPLEPLANKRIVVNLDDQSLTAFENGQPVFSWPISSGLPQYPTSPGIYQVLSHEEVATGSSFTLCNVGGDCGQWQMNWFMGMYEVGPGLMNGFHGAVLLPNGAYLGGGSVGQPYTYGCVMSVDAQAKQLYDWADLGTVVEVVSSEYAPKSDLGRLVYNGGGTA